MAQTPNVSARESHQEDSQMNQVNDVLFWTVSAICILMAIVGAIANSSVFYFANKEPWTGSLRHLNQVVKHLAISDVLYGVLGIPLSLAYWRMGKTKPLSE